MRLPTRLSQRKPDAHKGNFGHIFILAGSAKFSGAAVLSAHAAIRAGAGLVTLGIPKSLNSAIIKIKPTEVMTLPLSESKEGSLNLAAYRKIKNFINKVDIVVVGPGLSQDKSTQALVRKVISNTNKPIVIDADGLNALAKHLDILRITHNAQRTRILTPHPGEIARLLGMSIKKIQAGRKKITKDFAGNYKLTLVLKGNYTMVADYRNTTYINKTGNPGMATAGSGDVLTGIIAAFLGQGLDAFRAAKYAVYVHGLAGDIAAKEKTQISLIASDIIEKIPEAIKMSV